MGLYVCVDNNSFVFELCDEKFGCLLDYEVVSYFFFLFGVSLLLKKLLLLIYWLLKKFIMRFYNGEKMFFLFYMVKLVKFLLIK